MARSLGLLLPLVVTVALAGCAARSSLPPSPRPVVVPSEPIALFNGRDLSNFDTWLPTHQSNDPNGVFTVVDQIDGAPAIRISGQDWGGLITKDEYRDYHLIVEYRWGPVTWGERKDRTRDSGILLHAQGRPGNRTKDFSDPWMHSIEYQIIEGGTGDVILLGGYTEDGQLMEPSLTTTARTDPNGQNIWDPNGETRTMTRGRINWYGRDPAWVDKLGFRGKDDLETPVGEWNRLDAFVVGDRITYMVNGRVVMKGSNARPSQGKLLFQSEGAEIFFRRIELHPLLPEESVPSPAGGWSPQYSLPPARAAWLRNTTP